MTIMNSQRIGWKQAIRRSFWYWLLLFLLGVFAVLIRFDVWSGDVPCALPPIYQADCAYHHAQLGQQFAIVNNGQDLIVVDSRNETVRTIKIDASAEFPRSFNLVPRWRNIATSSEIWSAEQLPPDRRGKALLIRLSADGRYALAQIQPNLVEEVSEAWRTIIDLNTGQVLRDLEVATFPVLDASEDALYVWTMHDWRLSVANGLHVTTDLGASSALVVETIIDGNEVLQLPAQPFHALSQDGKQLLLIDNQSRVATLLLEDSAQEVMRWTLPDSHQSGQQIVTAAFSADAQRLAIRTINSVYIYETTTGQLLFEHALTTLAQPLTAIQAIFSHDNRYLLVNQIEAGFVGTPGVPSKRSASHLWIADLETGDVREASLTAGGDVETLLGMRLSADGTLIALNIDNHLVVYPLSDILE